MPAAVSGTVWPEQLDGPGDPQPVALAGERGVAAELAGEQAVGQRRPARRSGRPAPRRRRRTSDVGQRHLDAAAARRRRCVPVGLAELRRRSARCARPRSGRPTAWVRNGKPVMSTSGVAGQLALLGELRRPPGPRRRRRRPGRRPRAAPSRTTDGDQQALHRGPVSQGRCRARAAGAQAASGERRLPRPAAPTGTHRRQRRGRAAGRSARPRGSSPTRPPARRRRRSPRRRWPRTARPSSVAGLPADQGDADPGEHRRGPGRAARAARRRRSAGGAARASTR